MSVLGLCGSSLKVKKMLPRDVTRYVCRSVLDTFLDTFFARIVSDSSDVLQGHETRFLVYVHNVGHCLCTKAKCLGCAGGRSGKLGGSPWPAEK